MTRETKIGLLVGLAFIIVIGILLSDHMTSTTQPQQALLSGAAENVREGVVAPAPQQPAPPPVTAVQRITPAHVVPTQTELRPPPPPVVEHVQIGGPAVSGTPDNNPIVIRQSGGDSGPVVLDRSQPQPLTDVVPMGTFDPAGGINATDDPTAELQRWASGNGGGQQPAETVAHDAPVEGAAPDPVAAAVPAAQNREYVAQAGDNLSKLATRMLGSSTKANRDAILRANPSLQRNPDLVVEGRKYKVPASIGRAPAAANAAAGATAIPETVPVVRRSSPIPVTELVEPLPPSPARREGGATRWYVVKENDNLWRIATEQLGSGNAWLQIKELNKDILKGGDSVLPDMRLRLPARAAD